jgi:DNA-directed RNA polymerase subunit RPC12/RpoP
MSRRWTKNPWVIGIGVAFIGSLFPVLFDIIKGQFILTSLGNITSAIWETIISVLTFETPLWWLISAALVIWFFKNFASIKINGFKWTWEYYFNSFREKYEITNLEMHCNECGTAMMEDESIFHEYSYFCPRCSERVPITNQVDAKIIQSIIIDNVRRNKEANLPPKN